MRPINIDALTRIPCEHLRSPMRLIQDLTVENGAWHAGMQRSGKTKVPRYFALAKEDTLTKTISVPRAFDASGYLKPGLSIEVHAEPMDASWWPKVWMGDGNLKLGPHDVMPYDQGPAWEAISAEPCWPWGRILELACGRGKTILCLKLMQKRRVRTLVVCHTLNMSRKWSQTAAESWCIEYPKNLHGFIGDGKIDWEDRNLVFSSMPGLLVREYPPEFWTRWGLVIFDEGDLLGASNLQRILPLFLGERLLVTATISRQDNNQYLYKHHIGEVCFKDISQDLKPECLILDSPVPMTVEQEDPETGKITHITSQQKAWSSFVSRQVPNIPKTITFISENFPYRVEWAMGVVKKFLDRGRKILFLGERVKGLKDFNDKAKIRWPEFESGYVLGTQHQKVEDGERVLKTCNIIWAIQHLSKRGLDQPNIDTIIVQWASFKFEGRVQQTIGRELRPQPNKKTPIFVILNDANVPVLNDKAEYISSWLQRQGFVVNWYQHE